MKGYTVVECVGPVCDDCGNSEFEHHPECTRPDAQLPGTLGYVVERLRNSTEYFIEQGFELLTALIKRISKCAKRS